MMSRRWSRFTAVPGRLHAQGSLGGSKAAPSSFIEVWKFNTSPSRVQLTGAAAGAVAVSSGRSGGGEEAAAWRQAAERSF